MPRNFRKRTPALKLPGDGSCAGAGAPGADAGLGGYRVLRLEAQLVLGALPLAVARIRAAL